MKVKSLLTQKNIESNVIGVNSERKAVNLKILKLEILNLPGINIRRI